MTNREKIYELSDMICKGCKTRHVCDAENCIMSEVVAEYLINAGYRKMNDTVVLLKTPDITPEELERIKNTLWNDGAVSLPVVPKTIDIEETCRQIAKEIFKDVADLLNSCTYVISAKMELKELAKKYGVEIEE